jgi:hypothetical protein
MAVSTTAIMTWAHRVIIQPFFNNALQGNAIILQSTKCSPTFDLPEIDLTNSESNGFYVSAPGILKSTFDLSGIVDINGIGTGFETIPFTIMQSRYYAQIQLITSKNAVLPFTYSAYVLFTNATVDVQTTANGDVWKYNAKCTVFGQILKTGNTLGNSAVIGFGN